MSTPTTEQIEIPYDPAYLVQWLLDSLAVGYRDGFVQGYSQGYTQARQDLTPAPKPAHRSIGEIV